MSPLSALPHCPYRPLQVTIVTGASGDREGESNCASIDKTLAVTCTENYG